MPEEPRTTGWQPPLQVWLRSLPPGKRLLFNFTMWSVFVAGLVPWFAFTYFGLQFLPTKFGTLGFLVGFMPGVFVGVCFSIITIPAFPEDVSTFPALTVVFFVPLFLGFLTFNCVSLTLPLLHATIVRAPTEVIVRVASTSRPTKSCNGSLDISRYAFLHLCDVPSDLIQSLTVGDTIVLKGTGSSLGIFYTEMAKTN